MVLQVSDMEVAPAAPLFALARFGRWEELLAEKAPPAGLPYVTGVWRYTRGLAFSATGRPAEAARHFARVLGAIITLGHTTVVARLETALATGTPLGLALAPPTSPRPTLALEALPPSVQDITVPAARAADYDTLLGALP